MVIHGETKMLGDVFHELFGKNKNVCKWYNPGTWFDGWFWIYFIFGTGLVSLSAGLIWVIFSIAEEILKN